MSAWIVSHELIDQLVFGAIRLGLIARGDALPVGRMLKRANIKSIRARYGRYDEGAQRAADVTYYPHEPKKPVSDISLLKQVHHYDYQTCEYRGYLRSDAARLMSKMQGALHALGCDESSPEYQKAPWGL